MSGEPGEPGDAIDEGGTTEDDYVDVDDELEPEEREGGVFSGISQTLGNVKDRYVGWHTVDEPKQDAGVAGTTISRRGFVAGAAQAGALGFAALEATDGDGYDIDWNSDGAEPPAGGVAPPPGNDTDQDGTPGPGAAPGNQTATPTATPAATPEGLGEGSDRLYLQENGDVVAVDYADKEIRVFEEDDFTANEDYVDLYDELEEQRGTNDLPDGQGTGVEVTANELFQHDRQAYDDMADESEWDLIMDENPGYEEG